MINDLPVSKVGEYTVAGLILNELQLTNRFWNLYNYMTTDHKTVNKKTLYEFITTVEQATIVKIDQLKTMFNDSVFLNSISYDVTAIKKFINNLMVTTKLKDYKQSHIVTRDWPRIRIGNLHKELTCEKTLNEIDELVMQNASGDQGAYLKIVKRKAKIEVDILRMLAYAIRTDMGITPKIKAILSKYVLYFNPQRLAQLGICACLSIKLIRNILLENLRIDNDFTTLCKMTNETYKSTFNLAIKDEADLIFTYVMLMKKEINPNINLQEVLYFIFEAISRNDYTSISSLYVLSTTIKNAKKDHADEYNKITNEAIVSLVENARKVFLSYDIADDEFEHLSFNCLRTLIFEDQRIDECKSDYQYFFSYVLFDHNMNKVRAKINKAGTEYEYSAEFSTYYEKITDCMSRLLTVHPYVELAHDFVDRLIENACSTIVDEKERNTAKNDARGIFNYMNQQSSAVHKLATIFDHTITTPRDSTLKDLYIRHDDVETIAELCFQCKEGFMTYKRFVLELYMTFVGFYPANDLSYGIAVGELYIAMLNHVCLDKLAKISSGIIIPYYMAMYPDPKSKHGGHAYVKYVYNGHINILDPNFQILDAKHDASIADINIEKDNPFERNVDSAYNHVKKSIVFYGGHEYPTWLYWAVPILVFVVIAVVIFAVMSYYSNNEEKFTTVPTCFWHNH